MKVGGNREGIIRVVMAHMDRLVAMTTVEMQWGTATHWTRTLMGDASPADNLKIIMSDIAKARNLREEIDFHNYKSRLANSVMLEKRKKELMDTIFLTGCGG
jgi:hypothetical protein